MDYFERPGDYRGHGHLRGAGFATANTSGLGEMVEEVRHHVYDRWYGCVDLAVLPL